MKIPDNPGIWEWYDSSGILKYVHVCDVAPPKYAQVLRVFFWGGYYDFDPNSDHCDWFNGTWGNYVGEVQSFPEEKIYWKPDKMIEFGT